MVKIYIAGDTPVIQAMKRVTNLVNVKIVKTTAEADLIVAENLKNIEPSFSKNKHYAIITVNDIQATPENIVVFKPFKLSDYYKFIFEISEKKDNDNVAEEEIAPNMDIPLLPDAKRILVIDDKPENIISAKKLLAGHKLTVAEGYEIAMKILGTKKFDIVMTDLYMPMSSHMLSDKFFRIGELVPYGFLLMLEAALRGAKEVAIVTNLDHHNDPFAAAFEHFSKFIFKIENAKVKIIRAKIRNKAKDWQEALKYFK